MVKINTNFGTEESEVESPALAKALNNLSHKFSKLDSEAGKILDKESEAAYKKYDRRMNELSKLYDVEEKKLKKLHKTAPVKKGKK